MVLQKVSLYSFANKMLLLFEFWFPCLVSVYMFSRDEEFCWSVFFWGGAAIRENTVFRINKETGLLEFYGEVG